MMMRATKRRQRIRPMREKPTVGPILCQAVRVACAWCLRVHVERTVSNAIGTATSASIRPIRVVDSRAAEPIEASAWWSTTARRVSATRDSKVRLSSSTAARSIVETPHVSDRGRTSARVPVLPARCSMHGPVGRTVPLAGASGRCTRAFVWSSPRSRPHPDLGSPGARRCTSRRIRGCGRSRAAGLR